jgi:hypothetical protein
MLHKIQTSLVQLLLFKTLFTRVKS